MGHYFLLNMDGIEIFYIENVRHNKLVLEGEVIWMVNA